MTFYPKTIRLRATDFFRRKRILRPIIGSATAQEIYRIKESLTI